MSLLENTTFEDRSVKKSKGKLELILPISIRENTDLEIKYWTPLEVGESIIEQKSIEF